MLKATEITANRIFNNKQILPDIMSSEMQSWMRYEIIQMTLYSNDIHDLHDAFTDDTDTLEEWLETVKGEYNPNAEYHILFKDDTFDPLELISTDSLNTFGIIATSSHITRIYARMTLKSWNIETSPPFNNDPPNRRPCIQCIHMITLNTRTSDRLTVSDMESRNMVL